MVSFLPLPSSLWVFAYSCSRVSDLLHDGEIRTVASFIAYSVYEKKMHQKYDTILNNTVQYLPHKLFVCFCLSDPYIFIVVDNHTINI